jgi:hypothetical protein
MFTLHWREEQHIGRWCVRRLRLNKGTQKRIKQCHARPLKTPNS